MATIQDDNSASGEREAKSGDIVSHVTCYLDLYVVLDVDPFTVQSLEEAYCPEELPPEDFMYEPDGVLEFEGEHAEDTERSVCARLLAMAVEITYEAREDRR